MYGSRDDFIPGHTSRVNTPASSQPGMLSQQQQFLNPAPVFLTSSTTPITSLSTSQTALSHSPQYLNSSAQHTQNSSSQPVSEIHPIFNTNYTGASNFQSPLDPRLSYPHQPLFNAFPSQPQPSTDSSTIHSKLDKILSHCNQFTIFQKITDQRLQKLENGVANIDSRVTALENNDFDACQNSIDTAEVFISGLPSTTDKSHVEIIHSILTKIGAKAFIPDIITIRSRPTQKANTPADINIPGTNNNIDNNEAAEILQGNESPVDFFTLRVKFKSTIIRDEVIRLKAVFGNLSADQIFPESTGTLKDRLIFLNKWLPQQVFKLLQLTRDKATACNYLNPSVRNGRIIVRKNEESRPIAINSARDLNKIL